MADAWLHQDASVNVDIQSVADFAAKMQAEVTENFLPSLSEGINPMLTVQAPFGAGGGLGEGTLFRDMHERNRQAAAYLLRDVFQSLTALGQAAAAVAAEYAAGDVESAATTKDVYDAFTPTEVASTAGSPPGTVPAPYPTPTPGSGQQPPAGLNPDSYSGPTNSDGPVVVAPGTPGEYTIPGDNENMNTCAPPIPQPEN